MLLQWLHSDSVTADSSSSVTHPSQTHPHKIQPLCQVLVVFQATGDAHVTKVQIKLNIHHIVTNIKQ